MAFVSDEVHRFLEKLNSNIFDLLKLHRSFFGQRFHFDNRICYEDSFIYIIKLCLAGIILMLDQAENIVHSIMMAPFSIGKSFEDVKSLLVSKVIKRLACSIHLVFHKLIQSLISLCVHGLVLTALRWFPAINFLRDCVEVHDNRINRKVFFVAVRL